MNTSTQITATSFVTENKKSLVILFVLFLLSSVGMFGQNKSNDVSVSSNTVIETPVVSSNSVALDSNVDFMNWFMGTKHTQTLEENNASDATSAMARKKQIMSSGVTPNKVLYRTFVKRVISQESAIV